MSRLLLGGYLIPEKKEVILSAVKARVRKKIHKYGIEVPTSFVWAKELDRFNGNGWMLSS
jgi:hypothetical protein